MVMTIAEIEEAEAIIQKSKEFKSKSGCPPIEFRTNAKCFYCDDCWLSSLETMKQAQKNVKKEEEK